jgi:hypothetical protein
MTQKHTPGPWRAENGSAVRDQNGHTVCLLATGPAIRGGYRTAEEIEANTRLIAAAPEAIEALEAMLLEYSLENIGVDAAMRRQAARKAALAALAKAKDLSESAKPDSAA